MRGLRRLDRRPVEFADVEVSPPRATADQAVIAVEAAWIDLDAPAGERAAGAAAVGRVTAAGEDATHLMGQRVLISAALPCGECDVCRRGGVAACPLGGTLGRDRDGTLAEVVVVRGRWLCPLGDGLELDAVTGALIAGPGAVAYSMYARAGLSPGQPVAVIGRGAIATLLGRIAEAKGAHAVVADPLEAAPDIAARLATAAPGERRPRTLFELGQPGGLALAAALAEPASTLVALARSADAAIDLAPLFAAGVSLLGVAGPHPDLLPELAALTVRGDLEVADLAEATPWRSLVERTLAVAAVDRACARGRALIAIFG